MEVGLALFCRWCSKKLTSKNSRYRHEDYFHPRERKLIAEKSIKAEGSSFVKCSVCSVYTLRDVQSIEAHNRSQHHLCKLFNPPADKEENRNNSSYIVPSVSTALPPRYFEEISAYPRSQATREATSASLPITEANRNASSYTVPAVSAALSPRYFDEISAYPRSQATREATSAPLPITEATEAKSKAAAVTLAAAATLLAAVEDSEELEEEVAVRNTEGAETAGAAYLFNFEDGLDANQNYIFEEEGTF